MELSLAKSELKTYLDKQLQNYFPDKYRFEGKDIDSAFDEALYRLEHCFKHINNAFYFSPHTQQTFFHHLHGDQYASFLYFFANSLWTISMNKPICDKLIYLNRVLNNFFISYKCEMPDIFYLSHPQGTVIGNAHYENFLVIFQNVTIASSVDSEERKWDMHVGRGVVLASGAKLIGATHIGDYTSIGANITIHHQNIPPKSIVYRDDSGKLVIRKREDCVAQKIFNVPIEEEGGHYA